MLIYLALCCTNMVFINHFLLNSAYVSATSLHSLHKILSDIVTSIQGHLRVNWQEDVVLRQSSSSN